MGLKQGKKRRVELATQLFGCPVKHGTDGCLPTLFLQFAIYVIGKGDDPGPYRDVGAGKPVRESLPAVLLVVVPDQDPRLLQLLDLINGHLSAYRMLQEYLQFLLVHGRGSLIEDFRDHPHHADVVQLRRGPDRFDRIRLEPQIAGNLYREQGDVPRVLLQPAAVLLDQP